VSPNAEQVVSPNAEQVRSMSRREKQCEAKGRAMTEMLVQQKPEECAFLKHFVFFKEK
jgi:hypothetical protein